MMKLHNTLSRTVETFTPLDATKLRMYSCGPTVYSHIHIGNLASFIAADTLRRVLALDEQPVQHVMNFTDVDDKTIQRSREKYPELEPMKALQKLTEEYGKCFLGDMQAVGNDTEVMEFVKATDTIAAMQELITSLHQAGFAYITDDGVYFSIEAYAKSGKKYGQLTEITASSTSEARIQNDEYDKESVHDFALWKLQKPGEPTWDFELDGKNLNGRPGWHIECSAMSKASLGQPFDIHTGGVDLIFPHHENEIAQSTAGQQNPVYATFFAHNEHLLVDGKKMSKSLNNFYTLEDITAKGFDPLAFRLLILQAHYRNQAHFSWANLEAAKNRLQTYRAFADLVWQLPETGSGENPLESAQDDIRTALQHDLDTPKALARLSALESDWLRVLSSESRDSLRAFLEFADAVLGLQLSKRQDLSEQERQLLNDREAARQAQDWEQSDKLRKQLEEQGVGLRDTPHGAIWFRS